MVACVGTALFPFACSLRVRRALLARGASWGEALGGSLLPSRRPPLQVQSAPPIEAAEAAEEAEEAAAEQEELLLTRPGFLGRRVF